MVKINGKEQQAAGLTVSALLAQEGYTPTQVAVELNEEILPKAQYAETVLRDGDAVEIVRFVGGG
ncbi:MAG: sulfur carrier protein ThiS [Oscillospiraceae bacterium]|nr:sulfur carrier protein ThiS [Oscillospiraceae bacterium]